ncbi:MAG: hypothetical protein JWR60_1152 [Polaromonas sp.]|nr:hypothetical protein [Polaromonas sp.]
MPTLHLKISPPGHHPERCSALAEELTRLTALHLGKHPEVTAVMIDELPAVRWHVGGRAVQAATAFLEISITAGTNTAQQKADFIAAAFDALQQRLGAGGLLEPASYVIVREVPATDWGYGGQTQAARKLSRASAAQSAGSPMARAGRQPPLQPKWSNEA